MVYHIGGISESLRTQTGAREFGWMASWSFYRPIYMYEQDGVGWAEIREVL